MKNWVKKIGQNKFQFFFFVGVLSLLLIALVVASTYSNDPVAPIDDPKLPVDDDDKPTVNDTIKIVKLPFEENMGFKVVRKFYEKDASTSDQELSLIKFGSSYRTSVGTSYAKTDNSSFNVLASLDGTVIEVKESPLYTNYIVIDHGDNVKSYYYGLSEVTVPVGAKVTQGDKIGVSGITEIDKEAGNHVYFKIVKGTKNINPEKAIGKKIADL